MPSSGHLALLRAGKQGQAGRRGGAAPGAPAGLSFLTGHRFPTVFSGRTPGVVQKPPAWGEESFSPEDELYKSESQKCLVRKLSESFQDPCVLTYYGNSALNVPFPNS